MDQAVEHAVDECIKENILADFLRKNRAEVISMSIFEYDKEEEKKLRKAEYEAGVEAGVSLGVEKGVKQGVIETTRHLLKLNKLSLEEISSVSGLSLEEIKKLQN